MAGYDALFEPLRIKGLTIRNRFLSTSHCPGYAENGRIGERYVRYHEEKARGGVGLTQFGGATTVSPENSYSYGQVNGADDSVIEGYRRMAAAVHAHGAACTVQLTHGGRRDHWDVDRWMPTFSASCTRSIVHGSFPVEMEDHDIRRIRGDFAAAARRAREGDLDGVEISCQADTLIEQFWSPEWNRRTDGYGGSLANRMRFGLEVLESVRESVGDDFVVGIRMPGDQMMERGLDGDDCVEIARAYAASGLVDFVSVVGAQASTHRDTAKIWPTMWLPSAAFLALARAIRAEVSIPVFHATRIPDAATAAHAVESGAVDMVGMTRAFIADPHHVTKLREGREAEIRPCVGAGYCVDRVLLGRDALCLHNVAAGRETGLAHRIEPGSGPGRKVVVVGGGPGGLEAARVSASRGHQVVLFEAAPALGGQLRLASRATWRRDLSGIVAWLETEMERLGVAVHLNRLAEMSDVLAESPDVVVVATGGVSDPGHFEGSALAASTWDILAGESPGGGEVLVYDEHGGHNALACVEHLAAAGSKVELVTPHTAPGLALGDTNRGAHLAELHRLRVAIRPDHRLVRIERADNRLQAHLVSLYGDASVVVDCDRVVYEHGTIANDDLYRALRPRSRNLGEVDIAALIAFEPSVREPNPDGRFDLFRIGDAWTSRNVHAAMLDAMRVCKDL